TSCAASRLADTGRRRWRIRSSDVPHFPTDIPLVIGRYWLVTRPYGHCFTRFLVVKHVASNVRRAFDYARIAPGRLMNRPSASEPSARKLHGSTQIRSGGLESSPAKPPAGQAYRSITDHSANIVGYTVQ